MNTDTACELSISSSVRSGNSLVTMEISPEIDVVTSDDDGCTTDRGFDDTFEATDQSIVSGSSPAIEEMKGSLKDKMEEAMEDPDLMRRMWEKEMYHLKPEEREAAFDELHGVEYNNKPIHRKFTLGEESSKSIEEPNQRKFALNEMQEKIDELVSPFLRLSTKNEKNRKRPYYAYRRGIELSSKYISTPEFLLKFLRADQFNVKKAARRYFDCLDFLFDFFGDIALQRQLYLSDLGSTELRFFRSGTIQVLPSRDRVGRRVLAFVGRNQAFDEEEFEASCRSTLYLLWAVLGEDVTTQIKGAVVLIYPPAGEDGEKFRREEAMILNRVITDFPIRYSAFHFAIPDSPLYNVVRSLSLALIGAKSRRVCRMHTGSLLEVSYTLASYGIIAKDIPITHTKMVKTKNWVRIAKVRTAIDNFRKKLEAAAACGDEIDEGSSSVCGVECPEVNCILFGNKAMAWEHPGNIEFRDLIEEMELRRERESHTKNASLKGHRYIDAIVDEGRARGFIFMEFNHEHQWHVEIKDTVKLRHKITQLLTGIRKRRKAARIALKMKTDSRSESLGLLSVDRSASKRKICGTFCKFDRTN